MITITIKKKVERTVTVTKNWLKKETPTEIKRSRTNYGESNEEVQFAREYEVGDVQEKQFSEFLLLSQEIEDDSQFNLASVIAAINPGTKTS